MIDIRRTRTLRAEETGQGPVVYVMARDQRVSDNWALLYAQQLALEQKQPLLVACPLAADYPDAPDRQRRFMTAGLREVGTRLQKLGIGFVATDTPAETSLPALIQHIGAGALVADFNPLRESNRWKSQVAGRVTIPVIEVDAHNIVPVWETSDKQEFAAYTIRPKINRKLAEYLEPIPAVKKHPFSAEGLSLPDNWFSTDAFPEGNRYPQTAAIFGSGEKAAGQQLDLFLRERLSGYSELRNIPTLKGQSDLSPYLHFGQLSAQRVALEAQRYDHNLGSLEAFLEELVVRRELSDNFCYYNDKYDSFEAFPDWARKTLNEHRLDPRPYLYDLKTLEAAETHDDLWNAAQREMIVTGKMHGYMRMYWAKKILEWAASPEEALAHAIYLNNEYELDGHDPNGYTGIAWSVGGVHDRAWPEREVFGKIRFMSLGGCKRKFPVAEYIERAASLESESPA